MARARRGRFTTDDDDDEGEGGPVECTGRACKACTAGAVADCVAVCCCPCAVLELLALALLKVPYMVGRRCYRLFFKRKGRFLEGKKIGEGSLGRVVVEGRRDGEGHIGNDIGGGGYCAGAEAERVWLELYQVGHLGFGRVSFTGIPVKGS
ncbi:hypothetical protein QJS10_CPA01g01309 [Acorus calamus]|uniref:Uncharacterized protein n=1 Tax=Acorus calamus TaxID=4465 RepID=A0AAV9FGG2_ACOCL|nr:hypothetical protein QJS10_CPA01g01309 [Acorus calamus]